MHIIYGTMYGMRKASQPLDTDSTSLHSHTQAYLSIIITTYAIIIKERGKKRLHRLETLFMQQSFVSIQTNKYEKIKKIRISQFWLLLHIDMWLIAAQNFSTLCSICDLFMNLWFLYFFPLFFFSFSFYSIFSDWIIIISVDCVFVRLHAPRESWHQFVLIRLRCIVHSIRFVYRIVAGYEERADEWVRRVRVCVLCMKLI